MLLLTAPAAGAFREQVICMHGTHANLATLPTLSFSRADLAACLRSVAIHATEQDLIRYADEAGLVIEATHSINYTGVWQCSLLLSCW